MKLYKQLTENYTVVSNEIFEHGISLKGIGLYLYLVSKPNDWEFSRDGISAQVSDGSDSVRSGMQELEDAGFLFRTRKRNEDGTLGNSVWVISDKPMSEKPMLDNPTLVKQPQVNTNIVSTKVNKKKKEKRKDDSVLSLDDLRQIGREEFGLTKKTTLEQYEDYLEYNETKRKKPIVDHKRGFRNWIKKAIEFGRVEREIKSWADIAEEEGVELA